MSDFTAPKPISEAMDEDLFSTGNNLSEALRMRCRYHWLHAKIQARQEQGLDCSDLMATLSEMENELWEEYDLRPSEVLSATMSNT